MGVNMEKIGIKGRRPDSYQPGATPQVEGHSRSIRAEGQFHMYLERAFSPSLPGCIEPGALPQVGMERAFGAVISSVWLFQIECVQGAALSADSKPSGLNLCSQPLQFPLRRSNVVNDFK
jgi:hypothetical protein